MINSLINNSKVLELLGYHKIISYKKRIYKSSIFKPVKIYDKKTIFLFDNNEVYKRIFDSQSKRITLNYDVYFFNETFVPRGCRKYYLVIY